MEDDLSYTTCERCIKFRKLTNNPIARCKHCTPVQLLCTFSEDYWNCLNWKCSLCDAVTDQVSTDGTHFPCKGRYKETKTKQKLERQNCVDCKEGFCWKHEPLCRITGKECRTTYDDYTNRYKCRDCQ